jgi:hypothetical protein
MISNMFMPFVQAFWNLGLSASDTVAPVEGAPIISEALLREYASEAFKRFADVWNIDDFWKRANTCDAALDFAAALHDHWPDDGEVKLIQAQVSTMLETNLAYFKSVDLKNVWADDLGWWGLMSIHAYTHLKRLGNRALAQEYLSLAVDSCWGPLSTKFYDQSNIAVPVCGGCRNGNLQGEYGVKNTITNVLLLLLSTRLYRLYGQEGFPDRECFLEVACRQWFWFSSWFDLKDHAYLKPTADGSALLIQERPMAFFEGSGYQNRTHPSWTEGWIWSADQGLLVSALFDLLAIKQEFTKHNNHALPETPVDKLLEENNLKDLLQKVVLGIQKVLIDKSDGVIREAPCYGSFGPSFAIDYLGGRGVLVRYLDLSQVKALLGVDLSSSVMATVNALWNAKDATTHQFKSAYTSKEHDVAYSEQFRAAMGYSDQVSYWDIDPSKRALQYGICQAMGLDFISAALRIPKA